MLDDFLDGHTRTGEGQGQYCMSKVGRGGCQNVYICEAREEASLRDF